MVRSLADRLGIRSFGDYDIIGSYPIREHTRYSQLTLSSRLARRCSMAPRRIFFSDDHHRFIS